MSELKEDVFNAILKARQHVYSVASATPLEEIISDDLSFHLFVKREDLGPIKAYKWRGAYNKMANLSEKEKARGIVAASAGNHGQGVAMAAKKLGIKARIYMPQSTPEVKQKAVRHFGGDFVEIVLVGESYDVACDAAKKYVYENNLTFVHPYDDVDVMGGQGTLADEIVMSGKGPFDVAFLQIGGGGLAASVSLWLKKQYPGIKVYGVEGVQQASMKAAIKAKKPVDIGRVDIFCDGTAVRKAGTLTYKICKEFLDDIITVTNEDVCWAIEKLWDTNRIISETSGAMGVAAALKLGNSLKGKKVLTIISGANIDFGQIGFVTRTAQANGAFCKNLRLVMPEHPRALLNVLGSAFSKLNILEFQYGKNSEKIASPIVGVAVNEIKFSEIKKILKESNVKWTDVSGDADVFFRAIPFDKNLLKNPIFIQLNFYERAGALHDFLTAYLGENDSICYFNYLYTGERVGRALIGIEFTSEMDKNLFCKKISKGLGDGVRSCELVDKKVVDRLLAKK